MVPAKRRAQLVRVFVPPVFVFLGLFCFCPLQGILGENHDHARPHLRIKDGTIVGLRTTTLNGRTVYSYKGVRYADVPVRFAHSVPVKPWRGVLDATQDGPECVQRDTNSHSKETKIIGEEDCLYNNVFTPYDPDECQREKRLPVMVFFHGGSWRGGSNLADNYGPEMMLMEGEIVLVVPNYRVGCFGFLSTADETAAGNWGLYDQYMALKWINENIEYFGGDPARVTIFGGSAGGVSVHLHCYSSFSKGLFHGMLSSSGTAYSAQDGVYSAEYAVNSAKELAEAVGCPTSPSLPMVKCLREVNAYELVKIQTTLYGVKQGFPPNLVIAWSPVHDFLFSKKPFFNCSATNPSGCGCSQPYINGYTLNDGSFYACIIYRTPYYLALVNSNPYLHLSKLLGLDIVFHEDAVRPIMEQIMHFYFQGQPISSHTIQALIDLFTDFQFYWPIIMTARRHLGHSYIYRYDYVDEYSSGNLVYGCALDAFPRPTHYDDFLSLFEMNKLFNRTYTETALKVIRNHVDLLTNFAATLDPAIGYDGVRWERATEKELRYLTIGERLEMMEGHPHPERFAFWERITREYNAFGNDFLDIHERQSY